MRELRRFGVALGAVLALGAIGGQAQDTRPAVVVNGAVLWDHCGGEDELACTINDPAYGLLPHQLPGFTCDLTLDVSIASNGKVTCQDKGRRNSIPDISSQILTQRLIDQNSRISSDLPIHLVPLFGTHNSYSNYQDGTQTQFNADQYFTITDQLQLGARHIRLDPRPNLLNGDPILCHASDLSHNAETNFLNSLMGLPYDGQHLCGFTIPDLLVVPPRIKGRLSLQRPFFYALKEIRHWLLKHPSEIVIVRINNWSGTIPIGPLDPAIEHEFGDMIYDASGSHWPTMRQLRASGKRVIVMAANNYTKEADNSYTFSHWAHPDVNLYNSSDNADGSFYVCKDNRGVQVNDTSIVGTNVPGLRGFQFAAIAEDRSLSNLWNDPPGLMTALDVGIAVHCGYSLIGVDFLDSLDQAAKASIPPFFTFDYTQSGPDLRPEAAVWSWAPNVTAPASLPATLERVSTPITIPAYFINDSLYRWTQADALSAFPYACAEADPAGTVGLPSTGSPWSYIWKITTATGPWAGGENACQELGSGYHFWHPMSSPEQQKLYNAMILSGVTRVWMNYYSGATASSPAAMSFTYALGQTAPSRSISLSAGLGGAIQYVFQPDPGAPQFVVVNQVSDTLFNVVVNTAALNSLPAGAWNGKIVFTETNPSTGLPSVTNVPVGLKFTRPPSLLVATPAAVTFASSLTQQVQVTSSLATQTIPFTLGNSAPSWLTVQSSGTTPSTLTLIADPTKAPAHATFTLRLVPSDSSLSEATVTATIDVSQITVNTNPANVPIGVDSVAYSSATTFAWVAGSVHTLSAPGGIGVGATQYTFTSWSDALPGGHSITVPASAATYTANFSSAYLLTLAPSTSGVTTVQNPVAGGYYPAGSSVTLTATPNPGFAFQGFTGDLTDSHNPVTFTMTGPKSIQSVFVPKAAKTTIATIPAGLKVSVDNVLYVAPVTFNWGSELHTVTIPQQGATPDTQYVFGSWNDGAPSATRQIASGASDTTYTATLKTQCLVMISISPADAGTVTGGGWFTQGGSTTLSATAVPGFTFTGFTGGVVSGSNPLNLTVDKGYLLTANFAPVGVPVLYASAGSRVDQGNGQVVVPIVLKNLGKGPAGDAAIASITNITVPQGAAAASAVLPLGPVPVGTIFPGGSAQNYILFNWPVSATRLQFTVNYTANGGAYKGSNTITLFR